MADHKTTTTRDTIQIQDQLGARVLNCSQWIQVFTQNYTKIISIGTAWLCDKLRELHIHTFHEIVLLITMLL